MHRRSVTITVMTTLLLAGVVGLPTGLTPAGAAPTAAAVGPDPGPDNPWLHRRFLAAAHAGGEDEAPHSTLYAMGRAKAEGVHILDTDLQLTSDGVPVIIHNDTVDRTTNATGKVSDLTYAQIHALDAGYWYTNDCWACSGRPDADYLYRGIRTGQKPPPAGFTADDFGVASFRTLFERYPDMIIDIEIKGSYPAQVPAAKALADLIHEFGRSARTVVTAFDDQLLGAFKQLAPEVPTSAGRQAVTSFFVDRKPVPGQQILDVPPFYDLNGTRIEVITKQFVDDAHAGGMAVWAWMDSGEEENADFYGHLIDLGVDGILSSRPSVLMGVVRARGIGWNGADPVPPTPPAPDTGTSLPQPSTATAPAASPGTGDGSGAGTGSTGYSPATPVDGVPTYTG